MFVSVSPQGEECGHDHATLLAALRCHEQAAWVLGAYQGDPDALSGEPAVITAARAVPPVRHLDGTPLTQHEELAQAKLLRGVEFCAQD